MSESVSGARPAKSYRGSRRRVRQMQLRGNWSLSIWLLAAWVAFLLFVVVPWMIRQSH